MKQKLFTHQKHKVGLPPGSLVYAGEREAGPARITRIDFDAGAVTEARVERPEQTFACKTSDKVSWINVDGVHDIPVIEKIGVHFEIHPLVLEDVVHTHQRPKTEDMGFYLFWTLKMITLNEATRSIETEQVSLVLGEHYLLTFQERPGDVFENIRERIRSDKGRIRKSDADYLAYALVDAIVDQYFGVIESLGEDIESMEDEVMSAPSHKTLKKLYAMKRQLLALRKAVWPLREMVSQIQRGESGLIKKSTYPFIGDLYDHVIQIIDMIETMRDMNSGMFDMYLSSVSNRMNEVMKVLTIIATIFIPLTFIAGVYGMNFENMPELKLSWGYWGVLGVMAGLFIGMVIYFRKKGWL